MTRHDDAALIAALCDYDLHDRVGGGYYIADIAPDSTEYGGSTEPGSPWDEACHAILGDVRALLLAGWVADWDDDDVVIRQENTR